MRVKRTGVIGKHDAEDFGFIRHISSLPPAKV